MKQDNRSAHRFKRLSL